MANVSADAVARVHIAESGILPARDEHREIALRRREQPAIRRVDLGFQLPAEQDAVEKLMGKYRSPRSIRRLPFLQHRRLDTAHRFHLRNARVGDTVHVPVEQSLLVAGREVTIVRHALVEVMRDEIEDILLEVRARTADGVHLALANHFRERKPDLRRAHRARHGEKHHAALVEMGRVTIGGVPKRSRVEVPEVMADESGDFAACRVNRVHFSKPVGTGLTTGMGSKTPPGFVDGYGSMTRHYRPWGGCGKN